MYGHWGFLGKMCLGIGNWYLVMGMGWWISRRPTGGRKAGYSSRICLVPWESWQRVRRGQMTWDCDSGIGYGEKGEWRSEAWLPASPAYLLLWQAWWHVSGDYLLNSKAAIMQWVSVMEVVKSLCNFDDRAQRGRGDLSRYSTAILGWSRGLNWGRGQREAMAGDLLQKWEWDWGIECRRIKGEVKMCSWPTCFPGWARLQVPREFLLNLRRAGIKQWVWGTKVWKKKWRQGGE